jgi:hypothetical protein
MNSVACAGFWEIVTLSGKSRNCEKVFFTIFQVCRIAVLSAFSLRVSP